MSHLISLYVSNLKLSFIAADNGLYDVEEKILDGLCELWLAMADEDHAECDRLSIAAKQEHEMRNQQKVVLDAVITGVRSTSYYFTRSTGVLGSAVHATCIANSVHTPGFNEKQFLPMLECA